MSALRRSRDWLLAPSWIPLPQYLGIALLARLPAVLWSRGYEFADHQYQYVDPAWHAGLGGSWWETYDYVEGIRSWVYPGLLGRLFRALHALGIEGAGSMMVATRFVHALVSLLPIALFWLLVVRWRPLTGLRHPRLALLFFACNGFAVYSGVQPTGPTFAVGLSVAALLLFQAPHRFAPFGAGLLIGLAFCCRFQDALFGFLLCGVGLVQRRHRACVGLALGALAMLLVQGLVDLRTYGWFLHSPLAYLHTNLVRGLALELGTQSWWYLFAIAAAVLLCVPPFLRSCAHALRDGAAVLPILTAAALLYLLVHSFVPRKALRFVLVALWLLSAVQAIGMLRAVREPAARRWHRRLWLGAHLLLWVLASFWYHNRGPVEAARFLGEQPEFQDRLVLIDVGQEHLGGHFYLRRDALQVIYRWRQELPGWLAAAQPPTPLYLLACGTPLDELAPAPGFRIREVARFADWPELREDRRRFVYRLERE